MFFSQYFKSRWERLSLAAISWLLLVAFTRAGLGIKLPRLLGTIQRRRLMAGKDPCPEVIRYASLHWIIGFLIICTAMTSDGYGALVQTVGMAILLVALHDPIRDSTRPVRMKNAAKRLGVSLG